MGTETGMGMTWLARLFHRHQWKVVAEQKEGVFEKQEGQTKLVRVHACGRIDKCRCGTLSIRPYDPDLRRVEVTL